MKICTKLSLISVALLSQLNASESVNSIQEMFSNGEVNGQIRLGYYNVDLDANSDTQSVTAIGGQLKYETASLNGINAGVAMFTAHSINSLSGDKDSDKFSDFLTSSEGSYTELAEAYLNYSIDNFNIRIGRQLLDTPLADGDDIAMTPNSFEAIVASYDIKDLGLSVIGANIQRMQGADAGYENVLKHSWMDTGDSGTNMLAVVYAKDTVEASAWYYDVDKSAKAFYMDASKEFEIYPYHHITFGVQYLSESEEDSSGIEGSIAGMMLDANYYNFNAMIAYNDINIDDSKTIFEGFGGGCSYTNMETTTAGAIDTDSSSYLISLGYSLDAIDFSLSYGNFEADIENNGHLQEVDAGISYALNDGQADISLTYVHIDDKIVANNDSDEIKVFANYNF